MAMIKCSECGRDISDTADMCIGCGAPILIAANNESTQENQRVGDLNGDGKVDFEDFKAAFSRSKKYAAEKIEDAKRFAEEKLRSAKEKDAAAVEKMAKNSENTPAVEQTESQVNRDKFKAALESTIDVKVADILRSKKESETYLNYVDAQILTSSVRNIFKSALSVTPSQIDAALMLTQAVLAPSAKEKANLIKAAAGIGGGTTGIAIVIGAIGSALGWGAPAYMGVVTFFKGAAIAGPIGWMVAGTTLAAIAGYFASTSNNQTDSERFLRVLKSSTASAVDAIWEQYEKELTKTVAEAT